VNNHGDEAGIPALAGGNNCPFSVSQRDIARPAKRLAGNGKRHLLRTAGMMFDIDTPIPPDSGWTLFSRVGINDSGQITGYRLHNGITAAYLSAPVASAPEPGILNALVAGVTLIFRMHSATGPGGRGN
jgi:hypothetical protein